MALINLLLLEYSKGATKQLINKFKKENGQLEDDMIKAYINRFKQIKSNLDEPDIFQYSWDELEGTVDGYRSRKDKRTKGSAIKSNAVNKDEDVLYDKNGIIVVKGSSKEKCIKLSSGYNFCIGSEDEDMNAYDVYRKKGGGATPYFVFNTNLDEDHRYHVVVIYTFASKENVYSLTDAKNTHENEQAFKSFEEMMNFFNSKDQYGEEVWGFKPTFLKDVLGTESLKINELIDMSKVTVSGNTITIDDNINFSSMEMRELPNLHSIIGNQ